MDSPDSNEGRKSANNRFGAAKVRNWVEIAKENLKLWTTYRSKIPLHGKYSSSERISNNFGRSGKIDCEASLSRMMERRLS